MRRLIIKALLALFATISLISAIPKIIEPEGPIPSNHRTALYITIFVIAMLYVAFVVTDEIIEHRKAKKVVAPPSQPMPRVEISEGHDDLFWKKWRVDNNHTSYDILDTRGYEVLVRQELVLKCKVPTDVYVAQFKPFKNIINFEVQGGRLIGEPTVEADMAAYQIALPKRMQIGEEVSLIISFLYRGLLIDDNNYFFSSQLYDGNQLTFTLLGQEKRPFKGFSIERILVDGQKRPIFDKVSYKLTNSRPTLVVPTKILNQTDGLRVIWDW